MNAYSLLATTSFVFAVKYIVLVDRLIVGVATTPTSGVMSVVFTSPDGTEVMVTPAPTFGLM